MVVGGSERVKTRVFLSLPATWFDDIDAISLGENKHIFHIQKEQTLVHSCRQP